MHRLILLFFVTVFMLGCGTNEIYRHDKTFENSNWNRFDFIELEVPIEKTEDLYDLSIDFIHSEAYAPDNIALNFTLYFSNGGMRSRDYEFKLKDKNQNWTGTELNGNYKHHLPILTKFKIPEAGVQRIRIENKMTKFDNPGVVGLNVFVNKSKE